MVIKSDRKLISAIINRHQNKWLKEKSINKSKLIRHLIEVYRTKIDLGIDKQMIPLKSAQWTYKPSSALHKKIKTPEPNRL